MFFHEIQSLQNLYLKTTREEVNFGKFMLTPFTKFVNATPKLNPSRRSSRLKLA
jgi:hypothetical protein